MKRHLQCTYTIKRKKGGDYIQSTMVKGISWIKTEVQMHCNCLIKLSCSVFVLVQDGGGVLISAC